MEKLPIIEIAELNRNIASIDSYQDVFSVADLDGNLAIKDGRTFDEFSSPIRMNALIIVLILRGRGKFKLDYVTYDVVPNSFVVIMPTHVIESTPITKDFKALMLVVDKSFLDECRPENRSPSMMNYMQLRKNPYTMFEPEEARHVEKCFELLRQKIQLRTHFFHKEVLQNSFMAFMLEIANILIGKKDSFIMPTLTRKEEILNQFLELLIENCKEEHGVTYYAEKLFITPQYLSLVLKELTGRSANKWIDEALMMEAKILLKMPQTTVQQVADNLNFSDQSTFGKFFKKHMGISPLEYRKTS